MNKLKAFWEKEKRIAKHQMILIYTQYLYLMKHNQDITEKLWRYQIFNVLMHYFLLYLKTCIVS